MSAENVKWQVNRAVRKSNLSAPARLIVLTLSDMADAKTGVIPQDKRKLSLTVLAEETGLGESTIKTQLAALERLGWVIRTRPDAKARGHYATTGYRIQVGGAGEERPKLTRERAGSKPSDDVGEGQEQAPSEEASDQGEGQEQAPRGPGASHSGARSKPSYIEEDDQDDQDDLKASATSADGAPEAAPSKPKRKSRTAKPKPPPDPVVVERHRLAEEIVRWWWNGIKIKPAGKNAWFASVATVEALLKVGYEPRDTANALRAAGKPATIARLEIELQRHGRRPPGGRTGSNDQHLADEMEWARQLEAEEEARQQPYDWEEIPA